MKNLTLIGILTLFALTSCANKPAPKNACRVKLKDKLDMFDRELTFKGNVAKFEESWASCTFIMFGCRYVQSSIDKNKDIYISASGLFSSRTKVGKMKDAQVIFDETIVDSLARVSDMRISNSDKKVYQEVESKMLGKFVGEKNAKSTREVSYSESCSLEEAAVGALALFKAKDLGI